MSKWMVYTKKADFNKIAAQYGIDPVIARIMRNRDVCTDSQLSRYLQGDKHSLYDPSLLKDAVLAVDLLAAKIRQGKKIRIVGDYDIDGICSICILYRALCAAGAKVDYVVPDRITDGYGINERLIDDACAAGVDTVLTCDNGIAAVDQIRYAKDNGLTVIVTDHHDIPFAPAQTGKQYRLPPADAIVNPKQPDCAYPFKLLCGAGVAFKLAKLLYERFDLDRKALEEDLQLAAVATVGDVVELQDENRVLVKMGLAGMARTGITGLRALVEACELDIAHLSAYHIGFVIGPCLNASGRLDTARKGIELLLEKDPGKAFAQAQALRALNDARKKMTEEQAKEAIELVENTALQDDRVLVVYLPKCHESIAGIIAGRLREHFYRPAFVLTDAQEGVKGSGRSIAGYHMFEELSKCAPLLNKFGGHPMAAGFSLDAEKVDALRQLLNFNQQLTEEDLTPVIWIDVPMPVDYVNKALVRQLKVLEPFGKGNEKPVFADKGLTVRSARLIGKNENVLKMVLESAGGKIVDAVRFRAKQAEVPKCGDRISIVYYPDLNEYQGRCVLQFIIQEWKQETEEAGK